MSGTNAQTKVMLALGDEIPNWFLAYTVKVYDSPIVSDVAT